MRALWVHTRASHRRTGAQSGWSNNNNGDASHTASQFPYQNMSFRTSLALIGWCSNRSNLTRQMQNLSGCASCPSLHYISPKHWMHYDFAATLNRLTNMKSAVWQQQWRGDDNLNRKRRSLSILHNFVLVDTCICIEDAHTHIHTHTHRRHSAVPFDVYEFKIATIVVEERIADRWKGVPCGKLKRRTRVEAGLSWSVL